MGTLQAGNASSEIRTPNRFGRRVDVNLCVEVAGNSSPFRARTVDISRTGVLLYIDDDSFLPTADIENIILYSERVEEEFGDGFEVRLSSGLAFEAEVVRVARRDDRAHGPMHMACRYARAMSEEEWRSLGFTDDATGDEIDDELSGATSRESHPRQRERSHPVEIHSDYAAYRAQTINLSADGALLEMTDAAFFAAQEGSDRLQVCTHRLDAQFGGGMRIKFREADVAIDAEIVHVGEKKSESGVTVVVGCRFVSALTEEACDLLGIEPLARAATSSSAPQTRVRDLLRDACAAGATDLHLKTDSPPRVRIAGALTNLESQPLDRVTTEAMALDLMDADVAARYREGGQALFVTGVPGVGRFRVQALRHQGCASIAIRCLPECVPSLAALGLEPNARMLAGVEHGLILLAGHARSGRSTTMASIVDDINQRRACHIVTLERPVEFLHRELAAHITQRDLGAEQIDVATAVRQSIDLDADVLAVSAIDDDAALDAVVDAAESGRLVIASVAGSDAATALACLVDKVHAERRDAMRSRLQRTLRTTLVLRLEYDDAGAARLISSVERPSSGHTRPMPLPAVDQVSDLQRDTSAKGKGTV